MATISSNIGILGGKPVIQGTRISVDLIMRMIGQGMTIQEIKAELPHLSEQQIKAAIHYAGNLVERIKIFSAKTRA